MSPCDLRRWAPVALAALACCSDPATLEVRVELRDPDADRLTVRAGRENEAEAALDCTFALEREPSGKCPLESGTSTFALGRASVFLLYGEPGAAVSLEASGLDPRGMVVGSTRALAQLPAAGERQVVVLGVPARTEEHRRLFADFVNPTPPTGRTNTALVLADVQGDGRLEVLAAVGGRLLVFELVGSGATATLALKYEVTTVVSSNCTVRPFGMALADFDGDPSTLDLGLVCGRSSTTVPRLLALRLDAAGGRELGSLNLDVNQSLMSRPVIFDPSGDGHEAMALIVGSTATTAPSKLEVWRPSDLHQSLSLTITTNTPPYGPVVTTDVDRHQVLLVAGNRTGGLYRYDRGALRQSTLSSSTLSPSSVNRDGRARLLQTRDTQGKTNLLIAPYPTGMSELIPLPVRITGANSAAIAVGDVGLDPGPEAVVGIDKTVEIVNLDDAMAPVRSFVVDPAATNVMSVLLANIDTRPGAEILSFVPSTGRIYANRSDGSAVPGWPLEVGESGVENRIVIADLDRDGTLEIVDLGHTRVSVVSLGVGTYDQRATPWPTIYGDGGLRSESRGEQDPGWGMAGR